MLWRKFNGDPIQLPIKTAVEEAIVKEIDAGCNLKVCIGTDSQVKGLETEFATVIVFLREGRGGFMYIHNENTLLKYSIKERMLVEVAKSIEIAYELCDLFTLYDVDTYRNEEDYCKNRAARKQVNDELYAFFPEYNLQRIGETDTFVTTVKNLLKLYKKAGNKNLTISELLKVFGDNYNIDSWTEYAYEMECSDFDDAALDRTVSSNLDDMEEALENSEKFKDVEEFRELFSKINSRYKVGRNYTTPKDNNIRFMISEFDPSDNSVLVMVKNLTNKTSEKRRLDLEGFEMLLNQPELF